jgi:hypothetical protein
MALLTPYCPLLPPRGLSDSVSETTSFEMAGP